MSLSGIAFDVNHPMRSGQKLLVIVGPPADGGGEKLVTEVRWWKPLPDGNDRGGTAARAAQSADELGEERNIESEPISAGSEFPSEVEFFWPSCCEKATFYFLGCILKRGQRGCYRSMTAPVVILLLRSHQS